MVDPYPPIADYALLADCHSTALVHRAGSIDWACLRRFDAGSAFGRLLDWERGGHFALTIRDAVARRSYIDGTLVLETRWEGPHGTAVVHDAFAMHAGGRHAPRHQLLRVVECTEGQVDVDVDVAPRFDYGDLRPWLRAMGPGTYAAIGGDDALALVTDAPLSIDRGRCLLHGRMRLTAGARLRFSLLSQPSHELNPSATRVGEVDSRLGETIRWWQRWSQDTRTPQHHGDLVRRSAAVLKGLTCAPTGAIVAAATTSLPEQVGGARNWDYRFCWIRDATMALQALDQAGHREVASGFRQFLMRATAGHADDIQIMYGAYGQRRLPEQELDLTGYRGSRPVRIGNRAATQRQLDVFGHILDAAHAWDADGSRLDPEEWRFLRSVVDAAAGAWQDPDRGMWEMRGAPMHFVHSKVMLWVALDRGVRLAEQGAGDGDVERWRATRERLREVVERRGVAADGGYFTQTLGGTAVDAALLRLPMVGFVDVRDPRMLATTATIRERLALPGGFIRRYQTDGRDGLPGSEGAFLLCSFWLAEVLALQGEVDDAERLFAQVVDAGNDLGLFAEEYDAAAGELLGNYPQAFTHLGLIQAAFTLDGARTQFGGRSRSSA
jgi:GH15 family glucan-1,4-alpha-glucosidase